MSQQDRRAKASARLKRRIQSAALRVLAEEGYANVSMRKIAARIDYSPTTIYRLFRNKEDLLRTIAAETYAELSARFEKATARGRGDPLATLRALVGEYVAFCVERPDMYRLYSRLATFELEDGVLYERVGSRRYVVFQSWLGAIRESIAAGALRATDETRVFLYLWDATHGHIDHRIAPASIPRTPPADDSADYLALVFRGIETSPAEP